MEKPELINELRLREEKYQSRLDKARIDKHEVEFKEWQTACEMEDDQIKLRELKEELDAYYKSPAEKKNALYNLKKRLKKSLIILLIILFGSAITNPLVLYLLFIPLIHALASVIVYFMNVGRFPGLKSADELKEEIEIIKSRLGKKRKVLTTLRSNKIYFKKQEEEINLILKYIYNILDYLENCDSIDIDYDLRDNKGSYQALNNMLVRQRVKEEVEE